MFQLTLELCGLSSLSALHFPRHKMRTLSSLGEDGTAWLKDTHHVPSRAHKAYQLWILWGGKSYKQPFLDQLLFWPSYPVHGRHLLALESAGPPLCFGKKGHLSPPLPPALYL